MKSQEWKRYERECKEFEKMIKQKEFHFSILCEMLKKSVINWEEGWKDDPKAMVESFEKSIQREISMARSCDAPNKPGYYRANND